MSLELEKKHMSEHWMIMRRHEARLHHEGIEHELDQDDSLKHQKIRTVVAPDSVPQGEQRGRDHRARAVDILSRVDEAEEEEEETIASEMIARCLSHQMVDENFSRCVVNAVSVSEDQRDPKHDDANTPSGSNQEKMAEEIAERFVDDVIDNTFYSIVLDALKQCDQGPVRKLPRKLRDAIDIAELDHVIYFWGALSAKARQWVTRRVRLKQSGMGHFNLDTLVSSIEGFLPEEGRVGQKLILEYDRFE
jgi:hypothetical protein